jgi:hypothetical protein
VARKASGRVAAYECNITYFRAFSGSTILHRGLIAHEAPSVRYIVPKLCQCTCKFASEGSINSFHIRLYDN